MWQKEDKTSGGLKSLPAFCAHPPWTVQKTEGRLMLGREGWKFMFHCSEDRLGRGAVVWLELARTRQASILSHSGRGLQGLLQPQLCD